jgi:hypothetical protein
MPPGWRMQRQIMKIEGVKAHGRTLNAFLIIVESQEKEEWKRGVGDK